MNDEEMLKNLVRKFKAQEKSDAEIMYYIINCLFVIFYEIQLEDL